jgi:hypothetical protein
MLTIKGYEKFYSISFCSPKNFESGTPKLVFLGRTVVLQWHEKYGRGMSMKRSVFPFFRKIEKYLLKLVL